MKLPQLCGRCGTKIDVKGHFSCEECYPELGTYGDEVTTRFWRAQSEVATVWELLPSMHIEEWSNAKLFDKMIIEAFREKDLDTAERLLAKMLLRFDAKAILRINKKALSEL